MEASRPYPQTFAEFERVRGDKPPQKFWIQDATEEWHQEIIDNFMTGFIRDEPISKYLKGIEDLQSIAESRVLYKHLLGEKTSLVCLTKDENGKTKLAGFNVLSVSKVDEKFDAKLDGWFIKFIINFFTYLDEQRNAYKEFGIDKCLKAMGLYVLPDYRGIGLGEQILRARIPLGKSMGLKVTTTVFTSILSQKQAYKAGFQDYYSIDYDELAKIKPEFTIPNIQEHTKTVKVLYKLIE